jgi:hypothetical protein
MADDSINVLVGTFSNVSSAIGTSPDITMSQCICIDTSTNRIGINTLTPQYAIDISNFGPAASIYNSIRTPKLIINDISSLSFSGRDTYSLSGLTTGEVYVDTSGYLRLRHT